MSNTPRTSELLRRHAKTDISTDDCYGEMTSLACELEKELAEVRELLARTMSEREHNGRMADAYRKQRDTLAKALEKMTVVVERVDGWEPFPSGPLEFAYAALSAVEGGEK